LTNNEFAELSLSYLLRYTRCLNVASIGGFIEHLRHDVRPLLSEISREQSSYTYLESRGCASIEMGELDLLRIFYSSYGGLFSNGFDRQMLESHLPEGKKNALDNFILPCAHDKDKLQLNIIGED